MRSRDRPGDNADDISDPDPDRLVGCAYWRCDEIFEQRTSNHQFCRKACRSRQHKWERSQARTRSQCVRDRRPRKLRQDEAPRAESGLPDSV